MEKTENRNRVYEVRNEGPCVLIYTLCASVVSSGGVT